MEVRRERAFQMGFFPNITEIKDLKKITYQQK